MNPQTALERDAVIEQLSRLDSSDPGDAATGHPPSTVRELKAELDTLIGQLRQPVEPDPFADETGLRRAQELVLVIGMEPDVGARDHRAELGRIGPYELLEKLGEGGMGAVYKALHSSLEKVVALKVLPRDRLTPQAISRFKREMKAVGKLDHPNIVRATDAGEADGDHFLVMEFVEGVDLAELLRRVGPLPAAEACELVRQAAVGLQHAHQRGMVHRDIKPNNIMLAWSDEHAPAVKVLDMGLALLNEQTAPTHGDLTTTGQMMGTLEYMSPEQGLDTHNVDIRADIYSLGATLYKLLCGKSPFSDERYNTPGKLMVALATETPPSIGTLRADLPAGLIALVDRMLAREPALRPATPADVAQALAPFATGADLSRLAEAARNRKSPPDKPTDQSITPTEQFLSSPSTGTSPTLKLEAQAKDRAVRGSPDPALDADRRSPLPSSPDAGPQGDLPSAARGSVGRPATALQSALRNPKWLAAIALGLLALAAAVFGIIHISTPDGDYVIQTDDPDFSFSVSKGVVTLRDKKTTREYKMKVVREENGVFNLDVTDVGAELSFKTKEFTLKRGQQVALKAHFERNLAVVANGSPASNPDHPAASTTTPPKFTNSLGMEFALVPKGKAWLGGGNGKPGDMEVEFKDDFYLGVYEVTQEVWEKLMGNNPSVFASDPGAKAPTEVELAKLNLVELKKLTQELQRKRENYWKTVPVECVSWDDAQEFVKRLNQKEKAVGWVYRLPTEAEWEYACRGGGGRPVLEYGFDFYLEQPTNTLRLVQANIDNVLKRTYTVGSYKPNRLGLYDMHGNVCEWCQDELEDDKGSPKIYKSRDSLEWFQGELKDDKGAGWRVARGGGWNFGAGLCRAALSRTDVPSRRDYNLGLRVARVRAGTIDNTSLPKTVLNPGPAPSAVLEALRRDQISPEALKMAGGGDPNNAPASLVAVLGEPMPVHTAPASLAFSPDGRWLASASLDAIILLREAATGDVRRVLRGHTNGVGYVAFTPDSQTLVTGSIDGTIRIWSIPEAIEDAPAARILEPKLGQLKMALSGDGRFLAACGSRSDAVMLWTWDQWDSPQSLTLPFQPSCLAFSLDGKLLACGGDNKHPDNPASIQIYSTDDGQPQAALAAHQKAVRSLAIVPGGKLLVSAGNDTTYVWDLASGKPVSDLKIVSFPLAISPDGKWAALNRLGNALLFDLPTGTKLDGTELVWSGAGMINSLAFNSDGKILAVGDQFGAVNLYDTAGWRLRTIGQEIGHRNRVVAVASSRDGRTVLSGGLDRTLRRWDLEHPGINEVLENDVKKGDIDRLIVSPDGETFVRWPDISVRDAASAKQRFSLGRSHCVVYSPEGKTIASTTFPDNTIRLWDVRLGREVHRFPAVKNSIAHTLAFSGDGKLLAAVANRSSVVMWNVTSGEQVQAWEDSRILQIAFHPTRELLAMGHDNGSLSLWDPLKGEKIRTWPAHTSAVNCLKFTPDGRTLITSGGDGTIRLWDLDNPRAREVIALMAANHPLVFELDASGKYLFAIGDSTAIFVLRLPGEIGGTIGATDPDRRAAEWVLSIGGSVRIHMEGKAQDIADIQSLPKGKFFVVRFDLNKMKATDDGLQNLRGLTMLNNPILNNTSIGDRGLKVLTEISSIQYLALALTRVTDAGLVQLKSLDQLKSLRLDGTRITDAGLEHLCELKTLQIVQLNATKVTEAGVKKLSAALPGCKIEWDGGVIEPKTAARFINDVGMEFAMIPQGKSWLGGGFGVVGETEVEFKEDFYLGVYAVTQAEWEQVMGSNPSHFSRDGGGKDDVKDVSDADLKRFPVECVSWDDTQDFFKRLNEKAKETGWEYRLPTEQEWEYACRGGPLADRAASAFHFYFDEPSNDLLPEQANFGHEKNLKRTRKVGSYAPNPLGLYDMHGNVLEWCNDEIRDPAGTLSRMTRGSSFNDSAGRATSRNGFGPMIQYASIGLRVARVRVAASSKNSATTSSSFLTTPPSAPSQVPTTNIDGFAYSINGNEPMGWKFARSTGWNRGADRNGVWQTGTANIDPARPNQLVLNRQGSELACERITDDIYTEQKYGDVRIELEFMIPKGSNSGVFLMGEYEININDQDSSGQIVAGPLPRVVARKPAGTWQTFDITFRTPRFDAAGKKTADASLVKVLYNGMLIHENITLPGVTRDPSMLTGKEAPTGPLLLQGSIGPVSFRNIRITPLE
jgi:formylglycine-generating enzyme required for sulfatase activity/WD40 repeat protein/serine/threonine protein kinase